MKSGSALLPAKSSNWVITAEYIVELDPDPDFSSALTALEA